MDRTLTAYLTSYGLSLLGNSVAAVVLPLVVLRTTGSALDAGVVAAATAGPAVLAGLLMGGVVDRVNRRTASVVTDLVSAAAVAALPVVDRVAGLGLGWFVLFGVVGSFGDVPGLTAREALLPGVARRSGTGTDRLVALRESLGAVVLLVGPAVAAGLVVAVDGAGALWVTAALSCAAAAVTLCVPRAAGALPGGADGADGTEGARRTGERPARDAFAHLREGWTHLFRRSPLLLAVTALNLVLVTVLTALQGLLLPVHFAASGNEGGLGVVLSALAAGMLAGSALYAVVGARATRRTWSAGALAVSVAGVGVVASLPPTGALLAGAVLLGAAGGVLSTVLGVVMTERVPDRLRGRVTGTQNAVLTAAPSAGVLGAGVLVEYASPATAGVVVAGVWCAAVVAALLTPVLRDLGPVREERGARPVPVRD
ncbi:MFS transporter [Streptomyces sp. NPDC054784]